MAFGDSTKKPVREDQGQRISPFLKLEGERIIRVLDEDVVPFYQYWIDVNIGGREVGRSIVVAFNNLIKDYMETLDEGDPKFRKPSRRMAVNVLDKTLVKFNSVGGAVYADDKGIFPNQCPYTQEDLSSVVPVPHDRVKIMNFGATLMDQLKTLNDRARSRSTYNPITIQQFDVRIIASGKGREKKLMAMQDVDYDLPEHLLDLPRYDLAKIYTPMPNEAVTRILNGEDYGEVIKELFTEDYPMISHDLF